MSRDDKLIYIMFALLILCALFLRSKGVIPTLNYEGLREYIFDIAVLQYFGITTYKEVVC